MLSCFVIPFLLSKLCEVGIVMIDFLLMSKLRSEKLSVLPSSHKCWVSG